MEELLGLLPDRLDDDRVVGGATFSIHLDDGDGRYEPDGDDAEPDVRVDAPEGFAVFHDVEPGAYWVVEVSPPEGLAVAPPLLVDHTNPNASRNCVIVVERRRCEADDDDSGGFILAVVVDHPVDKPLPPTDVAG